MDGQKAMPRNAGTSASTLPDTVAPMPTSLTLDGRGQLLRTVRDAASVFVTAAPFAAANIIIRGLVLDAGWNCSLIRNAQVFRDVAQQSRRKRP